METASGDSSSHSPVRELEQEEDEELTRNPQLLEVQPLLITPASLRNVLLTPTSDPTAVCQCLSVLEQRLRKGTVSAQSFVRFGDLDAVLTALRRFSENDGVRTAARAVLQVAASQHDAPEETVVALARFGDIDKAVDSSSAETLAAL